jgi:glucokinase
MTGLTGESILVYDVGGSHISAAQCQKSGYRLSHVASALYPGKQSLNAFLDVLYSLGTRASEGATGIAGAELAMPGPFDFQAGVSRMTHKLPYLYGVDLRAAFAKRAGWQPEQVRFLKDAAAFLLGEIGAGAALGFARAVGITLGTGVGCAFALEGRIVSECPGVLSGGEIWDLPFEGGILEDRVSSRAIRSSYERRTGISREVVDLAAAARSDPAANQSFLEFGRYLGLALRMTLTAFAPEVVVLGGGISRSAHLFLPAAQAALNDTTIQFRVSALLDHAPLVGAAVAWFNEKNGAEIKSGSPVSSTAHADAH